MSVSPVQTTALTVNLTVTKVGNFLMAGATGSKTVTIPANTASVHYAPLVAANTVDEENGSVTVTIASSTSYTIGTAGSATIVIWDDEPLVVTMTASPANIAPDGGKALVTFTIGRAASDSVQLGLQVTGGTERTDYTLRLKSGNAAWFGDFVRVNGRGNLYLRAGERTATMELTAIPTGLDPTVTIAIVDITDTASGGADVFPPSVSVDIADPMPVSLAKQGSRTVLTESSGSDHAPIAFTVTLGRALNAGERVDVPLTYSGSDASGGGVDFNIRKKSGETNTGVTLSGATPFWWTVEGCRHRR